MDLKIDGKKPDKYQKKVIKSKRKNLLVLAGAGSGKTFTIICKIKKLVKEGIKSNEILCISFTKASALNLEEKLKKENIHIKVKTFHSLGYEIIKKYKDVNLIEENILKKIANEEIKKNKNLNKIINKKFIRIGSNDKMFDKLENNILLNSIYKEKIIELIISFVNLYKSGNKNIKDFKQFQKINKSENIMDKEKRHKYFLNLAKKIIIKYQNELKRNKKIDFHDMINLAIKIVRTNNIDNYKYIIIDEYQDTSFNKTLLIKEIQNKTNAKIMAVGDDWQSIYSFTGSNLEIFTNFKNFFSWSKIIKLKTTYRNSKELIKVTSNFICKNPYQIKKKIKSRKTNKYPIHIYYYDNNINEIWDKLIKTFSKDTLVLSRNNNDINLLPYIPENMHFYTMHKSKGLESNDTIIINLEDSYKSIPSKIPDSEYLKYVKTKVDKFKYAEERRLFYVALTRCKNSNYLLVKKGNKSIFVKELLKNYKNYIKIHKKVDK